jgi:glutamate--cysteine ligase
MITSKEHIIDYFKAGIKDPKNFKIGIEHEKFLFNINDNTRVDYSKIKQMFSALAEFGWKPVYEKENIVALNNGGKNITLEPGNQIELSGDVLNHIHEACAESQDYLFELRQVTKKLGIKIVSAGFDPISKIKEIPNNPKQRYELMTKDMPLGGEHSLDMMYRTCGTQLNIDYDSEEDFVKKFKVVNSIVPISIALFANSSIVEKKKSGYLSYRSKVWQSTSRGGLPAIFFDNFDFEKYAEFAVNFKILFIEHEGKYISGQKYTFKDFMEGKIDEIGNRLTN